MVSYINSASSIFNESPSQILKISSVDEHKIVHLISRPTQLYYYYGNGEDDGGEANKNKIGYGSENSQIEIGIGQVCRVKVPSSEVFYIAYEDGIPGGNPFSFIQLFFHCSQYWAWCCGVDCCQLDPTILFIVFCVCILTIACGLHFALRSHLCRSFCIERLLRAGGLIKGRKRVIARKNAQRRKRSGSSSGKSRSSNGSVKGKEERKKLNRVKATGSGIREKLIKKGSVNVAAETCGGGKRCSSGLPQIVVTEPSSGYEPSYRSADCDDEEDEELMYDEEVEEDDEIY
uniref:CX domain-containing protein n=1 Tax=Meloidogyne hapla TaxID=6305 RepID=A0A1I8BL28_MELHA